MVAFDVASVESLALRVAIHPAWGWHHCARVESLANRIAKDEGLKVDSDLLHVAALLHDFGTYPQYGKANVDHADSSVEFAEGFLAKAGMPADRVDTVLAVIRGHMFYAKPDKNVPEAVAFHDADALDFLGFVGITRIYAVVEKDDWAKDMAGALATIKEFRTGLPPSLLTKAAREIAATRIAEMDVFVSALESETDGGRHL